MSDVYELAVVFRLGGKLFAFEGRDILSIERKKELRRIPLLPDCILGVINLMGEVLPVIDLSKRLLPESSENFEDTENKDRSCLIILCRDELKAVVPVDEALASISISENENYNALPEKGLIKGIITSADGERIDLIDAVEIFNVREVGGK